MDPLPTSASPAPQLSDEALELIAGRFKVLSEVSRLKLIIALEQGEKNVTELVAATGSSQANVSRQLALLGSCSIVSRRRDGNCAYYRIADPRIYDLCEHVCGSLRRNLEAQAASAELFPKTERPA